LGADSPSLRVSALRDTVTATFHAGKLQSSLKEISLKKPAAVEFVLRKEPKMEVENFEAERLSGTAPDVSSSSRPSYIVSNIKSAYGIPTDLQVVPTSLSVHSPHGRSLGGT